MLLRGGRKYWDVKLGIHVIIVCSKIPQPVLNLFIILNQEQYIKNRKGTRHWRSPLCHRPTTVGLP